MLNSGGDLVIGRNDAVAGAAVVKFWNLASATEKINVEVQGTIRDYGNIILDGGSATTSPLLQFLAASAGEAWNMSVNSGIATLVRTTTGSAILNVVATGGASYVKADNGHFQVVQSPSAALSFIDANTTPTFIPLSSVSDVVLNTTAQNLIGAINEAFALAGTLPPHNHDDRYYTKTEIASLDESYGSALIGHGDSDIPDVWVPNTVKDFIDIFARMGVVTGKLCVPIYYNGATSHVAVPPQAVIHKGTGIRWRTSALNLSWGSLDSGVTQQSKHAYYVYLKPDDAPSTTYTGVISDTAPQFGYCPTAGKEDWVYVGSFITDASNNVIEFRRVGDEVVVMAPDSAKLIAQYSTHNYTDTQLFLTDGNAGVVPETAQMARILIESSARTSEDGGFHIQVRASGKTAVNTYASLWTEMRAAVGGKQQRTADSNSGLVPLTAGRSFYFTVDKTVTGSIADWLHAFYRVGYVEDLKFGKSV